MLSNLIPRALQSRDKAQTGTPALCQSVLFHEAITNKAAVIEAFVCPSAGYHQLRVHSIHTTMLAQRANCCMNG